MAGYRFMFISDLASQILKLEDMLLEFRNKNPEAYSEAEIIRDYITNNDFLQQFKVCVHIYATCIEPLEYISSTESIVQRNYK